MADDPQKPLPAVHPGRAGAGLRAIRTTVGSGDDEAAVKRLAERVGVAEPIRPLSRTSPREIMPLPGEAVGKSSLRFDVPDYVDIQLKDFAHADRVTVTSVVMRAIAEFRSGAIFVREEDMVADKRKVDRKTKR